MLALVHYDRHRRCWSVKDSGTGLVVNYRPLPGGGREKVLVGEVWLLDARFVVRPGGRELARSKGRRTVHAWVEGWPFVPPDPAALEALLTRRVGYDPFRDLAFTDRATGRVVVGAPVALLRGGRVYA